MPDRRKLYAAVLAFAVAGLVAACSSSDPGSGSSSSGAAKADLAVAQAGLAHALKTPAKIPQAVPLPHAPPAGKTAIFLVANNPAAQLTQLGAQAAAKAVGWKFSHIEYDPANPGTLQQAFASALAQHPTVVIESGEPQSEFGSSTISSYAAAHVPIIVAAAAPVTPSKTILGPVDGAANFTLGGQELADWFVADSKGTGQALVVNVPGFPVLIPVATAFQQTTKKLCPSCQVHTIDITLSQVASSQLVSATVAALQRDQNIHYVIFDDADFAIGIVSALKAAGLNDVKIAGQTMDPQAADALRAGTESAWVGFNAYGQGYAAMDMAFRWIEHAPLTTNDAISTTQLLTKANIGNTTTWSEPANQLQQWEKVWKVTG